MTVTLKERREKGLLVMVERDLVTWRLYPARSGNIWPSLLPLKMRAAVMENQRLTMAVLGAQLVQK